MIAENIKKIKEQVAQIALQCDRDPHDIRTIAVSKKFPPSAITEAIEAGQFLFGENYIQEAELKQDAFVDAVNLHFIGHLQTNKAKIACQLFQMIETVDRLKLAKALNKHLSVVNRTMKILIQVNIGRDLNKSGVMPEEAEDLIREIQPLPALEIHGLMTIPPFSQTAEESRIHFRSLKLLAEELKEKNLIGISHPVELSMGMSKDFHVAIEEGATLIRIGTAIFGPRT